VGGKERREHLQSTHSESLFSSLAIRPIESQKKVLKDCEQMIAPAQQRLEEAYEALKDLLVSFSIMSS
jgi:hypothetical protein